MRNARSKADPHAFADDGGKNGAPVRARFVNDCQGLAHWIGRKFGNHNPMRDRIGTKVRQGGCKVAWIAGTGQTRLVYDLPDGRRFLVTVQEAPEAMNIETEEFQHA